MTADTNDTCPDYLVDTKLTEPLVKSIAEEHDKQLCSRKTHAAKPEAEVQQNLESIAAAIDSFANHE